jgi:hypothetical protein
MKKFSKISVLAICLAAFFTSCVKEEIRIREEIQFDVNLTRAGTTSDQQGDQIQDIMIWAFDVNDSYNCVGWRTYTAPDNTFNTISLHIPAKTCGTNGGTYRLVAVLNKSKFTDANGNQIALDRNTTYADLISGKFVSSAVMNSAIIESNPGSPAVMPVSHWMDVVVAKNNTHENLNPTTDTNWAHKSVVMPVYRTVAKSQFLMAKKGTNASFDLKVISLKLINNAMPTEGMILSSVEGGGLSAKTAQPAWFGDGTDDAPAINTANKSYDLVTEAAAVAVDKSLEAHDASDGGFVNYTLVGSRFIYETKNACTYTDNANSAPTENGGYYYEVKYTVDGASYTRYVGINSQIARNHDYQVRALVEAGGKLSLDLVVNEWKEDEVTYNYTEQVTVEGENQLKWTTKASESLATGVNVNTVTLAPADAGNSTPYAVCEFYISTPEDAEWHAAFVEGAINAFEFVDAGSGVSTISGAVGAKSENGQPIKSTIKIRAKQATVPSNAEAFLSIVVVTPDGRTLPTDVLTGGVRQKILQTASFSQN